MKTLGLEETADSPILQRATLSRVDDAATPLRPLELLQTLPPRIRETLTFSATRTLGWFPELLPASR